MSILITFPLLDHFFPVSYEFIPKWLVCRLDFQPEKCSKTRQKRKEGCKRKPENAAQVLWSEGVGDFGNDGMIWGPCRLLPGPCNLVYRLWACKHFEMGLDIQIPFATFLFDAPCPWLSPPVCLSWAFIWGWRHVPIRGSAFRQLMEHLPQWVTQRMWAILSQRGAKCL